MLTTKTTKGENSMSDVSKITQVEMAKKSGVDKASISRYLNGVQVPTLKTAKAIADSCDVPIDIFIDPKVQEKYLKKVYLEVKDESPAEAGV